eukprot:scaffold47276_cov22-Tisochrysis_lutea.AAC.1
MPPVWKKEPSNTVQPSVAHRTWPPCRKASMQDTRRSSDVRLPRPLTSSPSGLICAMECTQLSPASVTAPPMLQASRKPACRKTSTEEV